MSTSSLTTKTNKQNEQTVNKHGNIDWLTNEEPILRDQVNKLQNEVINLRLSINQLQLMIERVITLLNNKS